MTRSSRSTESAILPNRLWRYRRRMGVTQRQVAILLGYRSSADIGDDERGDKLPNLVTALKLEIAYRVPVAFLFPDLYGRLKATVRAREEQLRTTSANKGDPER